MSPAASFGERWARDNLTRSTSDEEMAILNVFQITSENSEIDAAKRARKYYIARGPGGLSDLWHKRLPDDDDILSSCQDVYVLNLLIIIYYIYFKLYRFNNFKCVEVTHCKHCKNIH